MIRIYVDSNELPKELELKVKEVLDTHFVTGGLKITNDIPVFEVVAVLVHGSHCEITRRPRVQLKVIQLKSHHFDSFTKLNDEKVLVVALHQHVLVLILVDQMLRMLQAWTAFYQLCPAFDARKVLLPVDSSPVEMSHSAWRDLPLLSS